MFRINFAKVPPTTTLVLESVYTTNELALPSFDSDEESADDNDDRGSEGADKNEGDGTAPAEEARDVPGAENERDGLLVECDGGAGVVPVEGTGGACAPTEGGGPDKGTPTGNAVE